MSKSTLSGRCAIVTGAGRGIGRSIALALARHGARVSLAARTEAELQAVQCEIEALGSDAMAVPCDVSREADVARLVRDTVAGFGRLDIVVNNAGMGVFGPVETFSVDDWDRVMAVNARGAFLVCREAIPHLRRQPGSHIVNIASVVGVKGYARQAAYSASKHAVMGLSKALARELQPDGIRVHAVCPGGVDTGMASQARPDLDRSGLIQPDEVADVVLFLVARPGRSVVDQVDLRRESSTPWA